MNITLGYADLIRLFNVDNPADFSPGLELRNEGVFVASRDDLPTVARGGEEEAMLTEHPTGNLSEPALAFPCTLDALEDFMEAYGLVGTVDAFCMAKVLRPKMWALARAEAQTDGQYHSSVLMGLHALWDKIELEYSREDNDHKLVVQREVLDELDAILYPAGKPIEPDVLKTTSLKRWPWGDYETKLLSKLAEAVGRYWLAYNPADPSTANTNETVSAWLCEQGVAKRVAEVMAQIIRADGLRTGPR